MTIPDIRDAARIVGGKWEGTPSTPIRGAAVDSRKCRDGDLFVALSGENTDGHRFVASAWENGAAAALVSADIETPVPPEGRGKITVSDPLAALQDLARRRRDDLPDLLVIGITGSNGKTTTKEILSSILQSWRGDAVLTSEGNFNSEIGLPITLLRLREHHDVAVLEMGINHPGEMKLLTDIARPDFGVVTNIGSAHIGYLGSKKAIAAEKRRIFSHVGQEGIAVVPEDDEWTDYLLEEFPGKVFRFGERSTEGYQGYRERGLDGQILLWEGAEIEFALPGRFNRLNALAAVTAAKTLGSPSDAIFHGLSAVRPAFGRTEIIPGPVTVVRDCYNANPESMEASLGLFSSLPVQGRRVAVLGEMLELGEETIPAMRHAGGAAAKAGLDALFIYGEYAPVVAEAASEAGYRGEISRHADFPNLEEALERWLKPGDLVLLKGSRGSALERLGESIARVGAT